jgi:hypothetical protein
MTAVRHTIQEVAAKLAELIGDVERLAARVSALELNSTPAPKPVRKTKAAS